MDAPREFLSKRGNWQKEANFKGHEKEDYVNEVLQSFFHDDKYEVGKPNKILYRNEKNGFILDAYVKNLETGRVFYFEVKRQNAAGNAHERAYKFHPFGGIAKYVKEEVLGVNYNPIGFIFYGDFATTEKYIIEITTAFTGYEGFYLLDDGNIDKRKHLLYNVKNIIDKEE